MDGRSFLGGALLGVVVAAAGAFAWTALRSPEPPSPAPPEAVAREEESRALIAGLKRELAEARAAAAARADPAPAAVPAAPPAKPAREDTVADRAARIRASAEKTIANADRMAEAQISQEALQQEVRRTEEARRVEDLERGGTMEFLRGLEKDWVAPWDLLRSDERYGAMFDRKTGGPTLYGATASLKEPLPAGASLHFPGGRHVLDFRSMQGWQEFPADLLVTGQGMDATLLVLNQYLSVRPDVRSLTFRDATLSMNSSFTDLRNGSFTISLQRCRVVGFDYGAGGSVMLDGRSGAFRAEDCRFEVGYGRNPDGYANLFRVSRALLARLDRCLFSGPFTSVYDQERKNSYQFNECRFVGMRHDKREHLENPPDSVRFEECTFEFMPADHVFPGKPRPLTDINPDWTEKPK